MVTAATQLAVAMACSAAPARDPTEGIEVVGYANIAVPYNAVAFRLQTSAGESSPDEAMRRADAKLEAMIQAMANHGVSRADLGARYETRPETASDRTARVWIEVRVRPVERAPGVLRAVSEVADAGESYVWSNVRILADRYDERLVHAPAGALQDARRRARELAVDVGARVGEAVFVGEPERLDPQPIEWFLPTETGGALDSFTDYVSDFVSSTPNGTVSLKLYARFALLWGASYP
jgi:uncharacterized protein YggE